MDLQSICEAVEIEFGMGGLSDGLYADYVKEVARRAIAAEREACKSALHAAVLRSLDEAGVKNNVLRGMCIEVAFDKFDEERSNAGDQADGALLAPVAPGSTGSAGANEAP